MNTDEERLRWYAFKKGHRALDPLSNKLENNLYKRLRIVYKAKRDCVQTLDPWLRNSLESISDCNSSFPSFGGGDNRKQFWKST